MTRSAQAETPQRGAARTSGLRVAAAVLGCAALLASAQPAGAVDAPHPTRSVDVIVQATTPHAAGAAVRAAGGAVTTELPLVTGVAARVPADGLAALHADARVRHVTDNRAVRVQSTLETDTSAIDAALAEPTVAGSVVNDAVGATDLHRTGLDGTGVRVALVDTGVADVPDLRNRVLSVADAGAHKNRTPSQVRCVNFSGEAGCEDTYGHGTFMAGLIAGDGAASQGRHVGTAPGAELISIKVAGRDGSSDVGRVLTAIQWAVSFRDTYGIRVLNLSLGTDSTVSYRDDPLNLAVQRAWNAGIVVVVSASNRGPAPGTISKPADDPLVLTVGATDDQQTADLLDDTLPEFSGRGPTADGLSKPDLTAPGARLLSLRSPGSLIEEVAPGAHPDSSYRRGSGTSMSAAVTSGAVALMLQAQPTWTPDRVKFALRETARPTASTDPHAVGAGHLLVADALQAPAGLIDNSHTPPAEGTGSLAGSRGTVRVAERCPAGACVLSGESYSSAGLGYRTGYATDPWTSSTWYSSRRAAFSAGKGADESAWGGRSWYGQSWYGQSWYGKSWYGQSWYGQSWYGVFTPASYGEAIEGSAWYGAWE